MIPWPSISWRIAKVRAFILTLIFSLNLTGCFKKTRQPIAYNHKKHLELGLECGQCHTGIAERKAHAGLPELETCLTCHADDENPKTAVIKSYASQNKPIPWVKVYRVPEHVYFSHSRHVELAKLECVLCHGDMTKRKKPVTRQAIKISMDHCINCHNQKEVTNDCLACHR